MFNYIMIYERRSVSKMVMKSDTHDGPVEKGKHRKTRSNNNLYTAA